MPNNNVNNNNNKTLLPTTTTNTSMFLVDDKDRNMLMESDIISNRMSEEEILQDKKFQNYKSGDPSNTIYIKNLSKEVTEENLEYIYGFVFDSDEETKQQIQIKLMKKGKLRGQAFITFPSVRQASQAMSITHGYMLFGQPMIVSFGKMKNKDVSENATIVPETMTTDSTSIFDSFTIEQPQDVKENKEIKEDNIIEEEDDDE